MVPFFVPVIVGAFWVAKNRGSVGYDRSAKPVPQNQTPMQQPSVSVTPPWFRPSVFTWPRKVELKQISLADLVELATIAAKIQGLASDSESDGTFVVPLRDPALEEKFDALLRRLGSTLRQMEKAPLADAAFWQKFGSYAAIHAHYRMLQASLDSLV